MSERNPILCKCSGNSAWAPNVNFSFYFNIARIFCIKELLLTEKKLNNTRLLLHREMILDINT